MARVATLLLCRFLVAVVFATAIAASFFWSGMGLGKCIVNGLTSIDAVTTNATNAVEQAAWENAKKEAAISSSPPGYVPRPPCKYTGKRITLFTAAGNGNWGDNMQPWTWLRLFLDRGVPVTALRSSSCSTCKHFYPWIDKANQFVVPNSSVSSSPAFEGTGVMWFGGGGLLGFPHQPLYHNADKWQDWVVAERKIRTVFFAVGTCPVCHKTVKGSQMLIDWSAFVSGRGTLEKRIFREALNLTVPLVPDPILSDHITYPIPLRATNQYMKSRPLCWCFRPEDKAFLARVSELVNEGDILYSLEWIDGNFSGLFPQATLKFFNRGTDFFGHVSNHCKMIISQRYHGTILGLRSLLPVISLYEYSPHKNSDLMELMGEYDCMAHIANFTRETARDLVRSCYDGFDVMGRIEKLHEVQTLFQQQFDVALKAAEVCR